MSLASWSVRRSAQSPADSTSTLSLSSSRAMVSGKVRRASSGIEKLRGVGVSLTNMPRPCWGTTMPSERRRATASRTTVRLTSYSAQSSASVGNCAPGCNCPERIFSARLSATTVESGLRFVI